MIAAMPDNDQKRLVWSRYRERRPVRVPVTLACNPRIILLDPALNGPGHTFAGAAGDPRVHVEVALQFEDYRRTVLNRFTDEPVGRPDVWRIGLHVYNVYEAAFFGAPVRFPSGQVPATEPILTTCDDPAIFAIDIDHPLEHGYFKDMLAFWHAMDAICRDMTYQGRPVSLTPWAPAGSDGPLTVACNLRGGDFLLDLIDRPEAAQRLLRWITRAAVQRRRALQAYWGERVTCGNGLADDSCVMLSEAHYRRDIMPHHQCFYQAHPQAPRSMHLCGRAEHLLGTIHQHLGVESFDTGFPLDHGRLRRVLGPDVEIAGGVEVALLLNGTAEQVYQRATDILRSGVTEGGRFILKEANNLPPRCPMDNLQAMYRACLDHGGW